MTKFHKSALVVALASASAVTVSAPAQAQAIKGVAVVDEAAVVQASTAAKGADQQIATQYAQDIQQYQQLQQSLSGQLKPLYDQANAEQGKPQPNKQVLQQLVSQINEIEGRGEAQLKQVLQPIEIAKAFVAEQLLERVDAATKVVAERRQATVVVTAASTRYKSPSADITNDVIAEMNRNAAPLSVVPTQQWLQSKGLVQGGTAPAAPATPQPEGR